MKQQKISGWLKGLVLLLAVMGALFFGGLTYIAVSVKQANPGDLSWCFIFFSWFTAVLCYLILFQFWKVCREIGKDNSFSTENAGSFHRMGMLGILAGIGYVARILVLGVIGGLNIRLFVISVFMILLTVVFFILCEALSRLIQNAYEVKMENELTI